MATKDSRGQWVARPRVKGGRLYVLPQDYGLPNTERGAEAAAVRALAEHEAKQRAAKPVEPAPGVDERSESAPPALPLPQRSKQSLVAFAESVWLGRDAEKRNKESTKKKHRKALVVLRKAFGDQAITEIDAATIARTINTWAGTYAPGSVRTYADQLGAILRLAVEERVIARIPTFPRVPVAIPEWAPPLTHEEAGRLVAAAGKLAPIVELVLLTGLRIGELIALRWTNVFLDAKRLLVAENWQEGEVTTPKGGRPRWVPLSNGAVRVLRTVPRHPGSDLVFPTSVGTHRSYLKLRDGLAAAFDRAGLPRRRGQSWHNLRHTYATWLWDGGKGASMLVIRDLLGHADARVTQRYIHSGVEEPTAAVAVLDRFRSTPSAAASPPTEHGSASLSSHHPMT